MRLNGLVLSTGTLAFLLATGNLDIRELFVFVGYIAFSIILITHIFLRPQVCYPRRVIAMLGDFGALFCEMYIRGEAASFLFPLYIWVILGNGFRFGMPFLALATGIGIASAGAMVALTPFWAERPALSFGLLGGLVLLPAYAATLIRKLSNARQQAEDASKAKSLFLASVSHELRTPLTAIIGMGSVLHDTKLAPEQREMTQTVVSAGQQLLALINDILDFSRIEAGQMPVHESEFDLPALLAETRALVWAQASTKALHLAIHVDSRVPLRLLGSERHLKDVLLNLVGNAVKFTETGSVVISVQEAPSADGALILRFEVSDTGIGIAPEAASHIFESFRQADATIIDRFGGTGLGLAICKRLVALLGGEIGVDSTPGVGSTFWFTVACARPQPQPDEQRPIPHLSLVSRDPDLVAKLRPLAVEIAHFMTIEAALAHAPSSADDVSASVLMVDRDVLPQDWASTLADLRDVATMRLILVDDTASSTGLPRELKEAFSTVIPRHAGTETITAALRIASTGRWSTGQQAAAPITRPQPVGRRLSILVADDNRMNQKVLREILVRAGHEVQLVGNGEEALDALDITPFDLVLMDLNMPVMNGIEATKLFRFTAIDKPHTPIVALTADATPGVAARCAEAGMDACLTKPVEPDALLAAIDNILSTADRRQPALSAVQAPEPEPLPVNVALFPQTGGTAVDMRVLDRLEALGGSDFLVELIDDFLADIEILAGDLKQQAQAGDAQQFRSTAHAMRSATANIGARGLSDLCQTWQGIGSTDLTRNAQDHVRRLSAELERVRPILQRRRSAATTSATVG